MLPTLLAAISGDALVNAIVWLMVVGLVFGVAQWALGQIPMGEPVGKVVRVLLVVLVALIVIHILLTLVGHPILRW